MPIFKKPKIWILGAALFLGILALILVIFRPNEEKTIGLYGFDPNSSDTLQIHQALEEGGYSLYYANALEDLQNTQCSAWLVRSSSDLFAEKIRSILGSKAIFIGNKPTLSQPVRFVGVDMVEAGKQTIELLAKLPNYGDTNEDGTVSCLLLTAPEGYKEKTDWERGLYAGLSESRLNYVVLDTLSCSLTEDAARIAISSSLSVYGRDIEVIMASSEVLAAGAAQAIANGGWEISSDLYLLSTGYTVDAINALGNRQRSGLVYANGEDFSKLLLQAIADTLNGKPPKDYLLPFKLYHNAAPIH